MIQQDSIQLINDSAHVLSPDSLARLDSLARVDSIATADSLARIDSLHMVDSIRNVIRLTRGFVGTPHPSLPQTENWVFIVLVALFFLLVFSISRSGSLISETAKNFFQVKERSSIFNKATVNDFQIRLFIIIFAISVISLCSYYFLHKPGTEFSILKFGLILAITFAFFGLKSLLFDLLGYVFLDPSSLKMAKDSYFNILSLLGMILFPLLIIHIYVPYEIHSTTEIIGLIICVLSYILIIFKLFQIFFHKIVASFYILLYLCTLEFLPLIALYQVYQLII
ncbi:MAG TPA: DUF4271 domain-containing protein [Paludibacter sp.]